MYKSMHNSDPVLKLRDSVLRTVELYTAFLAAVKLIEIRNQV